MKYSLALIFLLATISIISTQQIQSDDLDRVIRDASDYLNSKIPSESRIAILSIESTSESLSKYIIEELIANAIDDKNFIVVDRKRLDDIREELNLQLSGEVTDDQAVQVGRLFGAQTIITGECYIINDIYRFSVQALNVENASIQGQFAKNISGINISVPIPENSSPIADTTTLPASTVSLNEFLIPPSTPPPTNEKSIRNAIIFSAVLPGAGQFYVDQYEWTAYVFPVIEIGLWAGLIYFHNKGISKEREYERYALQYYHREYQKEIQQILIDHGSSDSAFYENGFFRLDETNTQHFFEDIGKYDKYIFGWEDWYQTFYVDTHGAIPWEFVDQKFVGPVDSPLRDTYIAMRNKAKEYYSTSRSMRYFIVANHALSALDAFRVAKRHNRQVNRQQSYSKGIQIRPELQTAYINDRLVPMLGLSLSF